ncbi:MAG: lasso peptide biosynthesis B2 protein [Lachnospiraceae bacterium]|nr:lasso peptide biosynthesis B2 protein [Lachnospiraceae bacterium]
MADATNVEKKGFWYNCIIARGFRFIKYNKAKKLTVRAIFLSAYYRLCILLVKPKRLHKRWGVEGKETSMEDVMPWQYRYAYWVAYAVEKVCSRTVWESKCLVRALTAQHLLKKKGIASTMYLGCKTEEGKMVAHAWLRVGKMYVTGGNGEGYSVVDKFQA